MFDSCCCVFVIVVWSVCGLLYVLCGLCFIVIVVFVRVCCVLSLCGSVYFVCL